MSDKEPGPTHQPYGQEPGQPNDPYGQPQGQPNPYGQQPGQYGQPQGQPNPYGQQPGPYGQQSTPYGQDPYGFAPRRSGKRPGTVTAAAWTAIVMSVLTAIAAGFFALALVIAGEEALNAPEIQRDLEESGLTSGSLVGFAVAIAAFLVIWSVIAAVLAVFTLRRSNVARILLVVSSAMVALLSLLAILSIVSVVPLIAAVATVVLLFVGGANEWFSGDPGHPPAPGGPYSGSEPYSGHQKSSSEDTWPPQNYPGRD